MNQQCDNCGNITGIPTAWSTAFCPLCGSKNVHPHGITNTIKLTITPNACHHLDSVEVVETTGAFPIKRYCLDCHKYW
jgi:uncharacterized OB-fold protein